MQKGQTELILFNNLYTQTRFFDQDWERQSQGNRISYFTGIFEGTYGISDGWNLGLDVFYQAVQENQVDGQPATIFRFERNDRAHHALTGILPKIKFAPFPHLKGLSIESGIFIPLANDPEAERHNRPFLANDQFEWWTELFYVHDFNPKFQLFTELDAYWQMGDEGPFSHGGSLNTPAKVFLSWFPAESWSVYGMVEFNPSWGEEFWSSAYYQNGLGLKYQITQSLEVELLYTDFLAGKNQGAGRTFNLGFRFLK